jgi:hypothetical protein
MNTDAGTAPDLASDLLIGAAAIAKFLYGRSDARTRRKVFHLAATSRIPIIHMGSRLCARKSRLMAWIKDKEDRISGLRLSAR